MVWYNVKAVSREYPWGAGLAPWKLNNDETKTLKRFLSFARMQNVLYRNFGKRNVLKKLVSEWRNERLSSKNGLNAGRCLDKIFREFDPGSGRTLAACLTHASRTKLDYGFFGWSMIWLSGGRVSNAWVTCLSEWNNVWKRTLIPHNITRPHDHVIKDLSLRDGLASD